MSETYRSMVYFALATLYLYRDDITPQQEGEPLSMFARRNQKVIDRVMAEGLNLFNYELSDMQIGKAVAAYCAKPASLSDPAYTEPHL